jgi:hypothetical protein
MMDGRQRVRAAAPGLRLVAVLLLVSGEPQAMVGPAAPATGPPAEAGPFAA